MWQSHSDVCLTTCMLFTDANMTSLGMCTLWAWAAEFLSAYCYCRSQLISSVHALVYCAAFLCMCRRHPPCLCACSVRPTGSGCLFLALDDLPSLLWLVVSLCERCSSSIFSVPLLPKVVKRKRGSLKDNFNEGSHYQLTLAVQMGLNLFW